MKIYVVFFKILFVKFDKFNLYSELRKILYGERVIFANNGLTKV